MRQGFEEKYTEHAKAFTEKMDPELSYLAVRLVKGIVNTIFQKSINKQHEIYAQNTIEDFITTMLVNLKNLVFKAKQDGTEMDIQKFKYEIEKSSRVTQNSIKTKVFVSDDDLRKEAKTQFREIVNRFNTSEETKKGDKSKVNE